MDACVCDGNVNMGLLRENTPGPPDENLSIAAAMRYQADKASSAQLSSTPFLGSAFFFGLLGLGLSLGFFVLRGECYFLQRIPNYECIFQYMEM